MFGPVKLTAAIQRVSEERFNAQGVNAVDAYKQSRAAAAPVPGAPRKRVLPQGEGRRVRRGFRMPRPADNIVVSANQQDTFDYPDIRDIAVTMFGGSISDDEEDDGEETEVTGEGNDGGGEADATRSAAASARTASEAAGAAHSDCVKAHNLHDDLAHAETRSYAVDTAGHVSRCAESAAAHAKCADAAAVTAASHARIALNAAATASAESAAKAASRANLSSVAAAEIATDAVERAMDFNHQAKADRDAANQARHVLAREKEEAAHAANADEVAQDAKAARQAARDAKRDAAREAAVDATSAAFSSKYVSDSNVESPPSAMGCLLEQVAVEQRSTCAVETDHGMWPFVVTTKLGVSYDLKEHKCSVQGWDMKTGGVRVPTVASVFSAIESVLNTMQMLAVPPGHLQARKISAATHQMIMHAGKELGVDIKRREQMLPYFGNWKTTRIFIFAKKSSNNGQ